MKYLFLIVGFKTCDFLTALNKGKSWNFSYFLLFNAVRDYTDVETPCSISNQEAKHIMVDDTLRYSDVGKVDYCGLVNLFYNLFW